MATDYEQGREDKDRQSADEEYMPEFSGDEPSGEPFDDPTAPVYTDESLQQSTGMNPILRKILFFGVIALAVLALTYYFRYQDKTRMAKQTEVKAEMVTTATTATAAKPMASAALSQAKVAPTPPAAPTPNVVVVPSPVVVRTDSAKPPEVPLPPVTQTTPAVAVTPNVALANPLAPAPNAAVVTEEVKVVTQEDPQSVSRINTLTADVRNLNDTVKKLSESVRVLERKLGTPAAVETQVVVNAPARMLVHGNKPRKNIARNKIVSREIVTTTTTAIVNGSNIPYVLRAIVPRRAWIQGQYGGTFTVTIGDKLPGYGRVTAVNAEAGEVLTSMGGRIRYGEDDH